VELAGDVGQVQLVQANVRNRASIKRGAGKRRRRDQHGRHPQRARLAILARARDPRARAEALSPQLAAEAEIEQFVLVSAIGALIEVARPLRLDQGGSRSRHPRRPPSRRRPSCALRCLFGPEDGFFTRFAEMARMSPALPLIGGSSEFQPVYVGDVAQGVANALARAGSCRQDV